jgi:AraC-like DNA-binding protein
VPTGLPDHQIDTENSSENSSESAVKTTPPAPAEIELWRVPEFPGLELMRANLKTTVFGAHLHESYTIGLNYAGAGAFYVAGELNSAPPATINIINPYEVHTGHATSSEGWVYNNLYVDRSLMDGLAAELGLAAGAVFVEYTFADPQAAQALALVFTHFHAPASLLERESLLLRSLSLLLARHSTEPKPFSLVKRLPKAIAQARSYLEAHVEHDISIDDLVQITQISAFHLIRSFKAEVGLTPHAYQMVLRVHRAQNSLRQGAAIADAVAAGGFFDQSHLNRAFKRVVGVTPGQYRRAVRP